MKNLNNKLTPEILVPRLGDHLVESGLITQNDLEMVLELQNKYKINGKTPPLLGQLLVNENKIKQEDLDQAITIQVIQLRKALEDANQKLELRVKERTAELQKALDKLSELNKLKSNFISNISHELRTPLTHLVGYVELFISGAFGELNPDQMESMVMIKSATNKLEKLIQNLIQISMADRGDIDIQISNFDLVDLSKMILNKSGKNAQQYNISISSHFSNESMIVAGDCEKISWVIEQLLDNAIKFNDPGGKVKLSIIDNEIFARITISDTGIGISEENQISIFEPFYQLDGSSTRKYGGTGLGLALVKKIIEAHSSEIQLASKLGTGSQFSFTLKKGILSD